MFPPSYVIRSWFMIQGYLGTCHRQRQVTLTMSIDLSHRRHISSIRVVLSSIWRP